MTRYPLVEPDTTNVTGGFDDQVTIEMLGSTVHICPLLLWYLTELSSIGPGLQEERLVFADAVLMDRLLIASLVRHLMRERERVSRVGEG